MKRITYTLPAAALLGSIVLAAASASGDPISADRPGAGCSGSVVGKLRFQLETGVDASADKSDGARTVSFRTPAKLRLGLLEKLEVHLETAAFSSDTTIQGGGKWAVYGFSDLAFGLKARFYEGGGLRGAAPSTSLLVSITAPTGTSGFTGDEFVPFAAAIMEWGLPEDFGIGANLAAGVPSHEIKQVRFVQGFFSLCISRPWTPLTDRVSTFVELFGDLSFSRHAVSSLSIDGGFAILLTDDVQFDMWGAAGITDNAADLAGGAGIAARL